MAKEGRTLNWLKRAINAFYGLDFACRAEAA